MEDLYLCFTPVSRPAAQQASGVRCFSKKDVPSSSGCIDRVLPSTLRWTSIMKPWFAAIFILFVCLGTKAQPSTNLAYDDKFVWYLSGRLASELTTFQARSGIILSEGELAEQRQQFEIVYHHYLVRCDGPLAQIASALKLADMSITSQLPGTQLLGYVGSMDYEIWPRIQAWHAKVLTELLATYKAGKYGFFPDCVVSGYRDQNP